MTRLFARWPLPVAVVLASAPRRSRRTLRRPRLEDTRLEDQDRDRDHRATTTKTCGTIAPVAVQPVAPTYAPAPVRRRPTSLRRFICTRGPCPDAVARRLLFSLRLMPRRLMPRPPSRRWPTSPRLAPHGFCPGPVAPMAYVPAAYAPAPSRRWLLSPRLMPRHPRPRCLPLHLNQLRRKPRHHRPRASARPSRSFIQGNGSIHGLD